MTLGGGSPSQSESALLALNKRKAQLDRWRGSDTEKESTEIKSRPKRVKFADKCIFQAACASGDKGQVARMIKEGYDINAVDEDGITALHQACIEDNFEMVEFLLQNGADVNISDNEGWTPLHAVATCCYVSIAKLLLEHGANVVALNNDCSIPLDICKSDEIRELFIQEINGKGIDLKDARRGEELKMLDDAKKWLSSGAVDENAHPITGATAMHVAACKGYIKVLDLLIKAGANMNAQDFDGWTPLHAAAHWGQKEACEVLLENMCDMGIRNNCDQTALDISDNSVIPLLEEWKKKHDVNKNIDNKQQALNNNNNNTQASPKKKSAAQRPDSSSEQDVTIVTSQLGQGDVTSKSSDETHAEIDKPLEINPVVVDGANEETVHDPVEDEAEDTLSELPSSTTQETAGVVMTTEPISLTHSHLNDPQPAVASSPPTSTSISVVVSAEEPPTSTTSPSASINQTTLSSSSAKSSSSDKSSDQSALDKRIDTETQPTDESSSGFQPHSWRRGGSLRTRTTGLTASSSTSTGSGGTEDSTTAAASSNKGTSERLTVRRTQSAATSADASLRRAYSFESDAKFYSRLRDARERIKAMEDASARVSSGTNTTSALSSSFTTLSTTTTTVTPAGSVGTGTSALNSSYSGLSSSDALTSSSLLASSLSRHSRLRNAGLTSSSTTSSSLSTNPSSSISTRRGGGGVGGATNSPNNHAVTITTPAVLLSNSTESSSSITSSSSHSAVVEPPPLQEEDDDKFSTVILRRSKEGETNRVQHHRPNTMGSPNPSSRATSNTTAPTTTNTTTSSLPQNYSETKHTRSGVESSNNDGGAVPPPQQISIPQFLFHNSNSSLNLASKPTGAVTKFKNFFKSFVPPTRDEESETQRKAHAKRVRETRRSTQGVTLEELKSAEQYVKNSQTSGGSNASGSTNTSSVPVSSSGRKDQQQQQQMQDDANVERRPSWRLRVDEQDRSKFSLEDTRQQGAAGAAAGSSSSLASNPSSSTAAPTSRLGGYHSEIPYGLAQRNPSLRSKLGKGMLIDQTMLANAGAPSAQSNSGASSSTPQGKPPLPPGGEGQESNTAQQDDDRDVRNSGGAQGAILRKKKTKRRSTGVVQFNTDATSPQDPQDSVPSDSEIGREVSSDVEGTESKSENGVPQRINYRKLYEEVLKENQTLKSKLSRAEEDIAELKLKLDKLSMTPRITSDDTEKMEKRALERKLSEMEEELKQMQRLKLDSEKLKAENRALTRVVSKLSGNSNGGVIGSGHAHPITPPSSNAANATTVTANGNGHTTGDPSFAY